MTTATSRFHNRDTASLVDELGAVCARRAALDAEEKAIKDELKRRKVDRAAGDSYMVWIERSTCWLLDIGAIRQEMGEDWCSQRSKVQGRTAVKVKPVDPATCTTEH